MPLIPAVWNIPDDESDLTEPPTSDEEDEVEDEKEVQKSPAQLPTPPTPTRPCSPPPIPTTKAKPTRASTQQATQKSRARKNGSKDVQPSLTEAQYITHPAYYLADLILEGRIDVNPEYQRGVVWNDSKQGALIDSLIHNYHTPPIVLAKSVNEDGLDVWRCIDGKQRLTSLVRFFKGEVLKLASDSLIPYKDSISNKKFWYLNQPGYRRRLISPVVKTKLREKRIAINEYTSITEEQERAVFQRVQLGVALGPADRLPAINGANADLVRDLRRRINTTDGFEGYLDWGRARGKDFQALARIVYFMVHGQTRKWDPTASRLEAFLHEKADNYTKLRENAYQTTDILCRITQHPSFSTCFDNLSPLEFVMSTYLISRERRKLTDSQLSAAIIRMREDYKSQRKDFKCGGPNYKCMMNFIDKQLPKIVPTLTKLPGELTAALTPYDRRELDYDQFKDIADQPPQAEAPNKKKRKCSIEDDGDMADSEEDDGDVAKAKPALKKSRGSAPASVPPTPTKLVPADKTSLAKTTVRRASAKRKSEPSVPPPTNPVTVKAPPPSSNPSALDQASVKPSPLSRSAPTAGPSSLGLRRMPPASRPPGPLNFQSGPSQAGQQRAGSTGRSLSDRLGPLKQARAEIQTNNQQAVPSGLHFHKKVDDSWADLEKIFDSTSSISQSAPTLPPINVATARVGSSDFSAMRRDSIGSPLTPMSASPSPMPGAYVPRFLQQQQVPQSQPSQHQPQHQPTQHRPTLLQHHHQQAPQPQHVQPPIRPQVVAQTQHHHAGPGGLPETQTGSQGPHNQKGQCNPLPRRPMHPRVAKPQFFRASRDVDPNIARATAEINRGPPSCNDLRAAQSQGARQLPNNLNPAVSMDLLTPKQIQQQHQ
ncbi:hypothetical protein CVT24_009211 [Panaeolus cyanescens]|uniref:GmrSD restriction endonucleases N-terminal domain-containing protein n=1 Tax=Panaeolus cyanescens TaxID=181874 RepID=A0A409Y8Z4_9AGAR|nr:hypothetical protein CVT24_009211 [Panaeolus cyanescens]